MLSLTRKDARLKFKMFFYHTSV